MFFTWKGNQLCWMSLSKLQMIFLPVNHQLLTKIDRHPRSQSKVLKNQQLRKRFRLKNFHRGHHQGCPRSIMTTALLPHGPVLLNSIYYQPVPAPHNVVVAQSTIPAPTIVPCAPAAEPTVPPPLAAEPMVSAQPASKPAVSAPTKSCEPMGSEKQREKPRVGLKFAMPETPPPKKSISNLRLTSCSCSRSSSRQGEKRKSPKASPEKTNVDVRPTGRGRGKKKPEMTNAPILVPTTHSHLISTTKPKPRLTVNLSTENPIPRAVQHL